MAPDKNCVCPEGGICFLCPENFKRIVEENYGKAIVTDYKIHDGRAATGTITPQDGEERKFYYSYFDDTDPVGVWDEIAEVRRGFELEGTKCDVIAIFQKLINPLGCLLNDDVPFVFVGRAKLEEEMEEF